MSTQLSDPSTAAAGIHPDPALRELLLTFYLDTFTGPALADWLRDLGLDPKGTIAEKQQRIREHTKYLSMPAAGFSAQTESYIHGYSSELLAKLCGELGVSPDGTKDQRHRRILREVHYREGWLQRIDPTSTAAPTGDVVLPFLSLFPLGDCGDYERDYYPTIADELTDVFGPIVYEQLPVAHGSTLKIDFHVGQPQESGVGIEVKMPASNADVQRAMGQLEQYQRRYAGDLLLFVLTRHLKRELAQPFIRSLQEKGIRTVAR